MWLVDELKKEKLSLHELNERWERSSINDTGEKIHPRTFFRHRQWIADVLQIDIEYNPHSRKYEILDSKDIPFVFKK